LGFLKAKNKIYPIETIKSKKEKELKYQIRRGVNLPQGRTGKTSKLENKIEDAYEFLFR
jgi:hypothetical protein